MQMLGACTWEQTQIPACHHCHARWRGVVRRGPLFPKQPRIARCPGKAQFLGRHRSNRIFPQQAGRNWASATVGVEDADAQPNKGRESAETLVLVQETGSATSGIRPLRLDSSPKTGRKRGNETTPNSYVRPPSWREGGHAGRG